jgi:Ankyrin repeat
MREEITVEAVRALIHAFPAALHMRTLYEDTPLHLACLRNANPDVVREVAQASFAGLEPFLSSCGTHYLSPLIGRNRAGQTPIGIAMEEYQKLINVNATQCCVTAAQTLEQCRAFEVLASLVKMLHYGHGEDDSGGNESLVAACLSSHRNGARLDPAFIRRAVYLFPGEAKIRDKDLNYPLHVEASIPVEKLVLLDAATPTSTGCCDGACHKRKGVLQMLMEIYPDAVKQRNKAGEFPLTLMVQNGRSWDNTFAHVVQAYPEAVHWVENVSPKVVSHLLAQVANGCGVDTMYSLIRARPGLLYESDSECSETSD